MPSLAFQCTDDAPDFGDGLALALCSGRSVSSQPTDSMDAAVGGSAGSGTITCGMQNPVTTVVICNIVCGSLGAYAGIEVGNIVVPVSVNSGWTGTPSIAEVHACRTDADGSNPLSLGSLTGLTDTMTVGAPTVYTYNVPVASRVAFSATQRLAIAVVGTNGSIMAASNGTLNTSQVITAPVYAGYVSYEMPLMGVG